MKFDLKTLDKECRDSYVGRITEVCSLREIEAAVIAFSTAYFCKYDIEDIPLITNAEFPHSTIIQNVSKVSKQIAAEEKIPYEICFFSGMTILQKYVQLQRFNRCKQVYAFDGDIAEELLRTKRDVTLPPNIFDRLPHNTLYLDFSACSKELRENVGMDGCLVQVNKSQFDNLNSGFYIISALLFSNNDSIGMRSTLVVNSEKEGVKFGDFDEFKNNCRLNVDVEKAANGEIAEMLSKDIAANQSYLIVQSLFYLCSYEPDIHETAPSKIQYRKARQNKKKNADMPIREFKVGERFGEAFRKWTKGQLGQSGTHASTGRHNKPHMRRAHWHRFWIGKRDSEERKLVAKWVSECFCGITEDEADKLDMVTHEVGQERKETVN